MSRSLKVADSRYVGLLWHFGKKSDDFEDDHVASECIQGERRINVHCSSGGGYRLTVNEQRYHASISLLNHNRDLALFQTYC